MLQCDTAKQIVLLIEPQLHPGHGKLLEPLDELQSLVLVTAHECGIACNICEELEVTFSGMMVIS
ncbi:MAG: hypothetical protein R3301_11265 [Saprospiraceae bacterium]|nr:hypothetical protein [Saprospiraceae bacterium]